MYRNAGFSSLLLASAACHVPIAWADAPAATTATTGASAADASGQIADIVVTATRQPSNVQNVSAAVTVIPGSTLAIQGLTDTAELFQNTPNIQATGQPGGVSVDIRGLGGDLPAGSTQGSVAMVFDGVYNINSQGTTVGFFDLNRVEVAAGPQSTRFGPDADGGIVQIISNDPALGKLAGSAQITAGNYGLVRGEAMINVPITSTLALRIAGAAISRGSYFTPKEGDAKAQSIRARLLWQPSDDFSLKLTYQMDHIGGAGQGSNAFPIFTNKVPVYSGDSINQLANPWGQSPSNPVNASTANIHQQTFIGNLTYKFSRDVVLDAMASYTKITGGETGVLFLPPWSTSASNGPAFPGVIASEFAPFHQFTSELRLHNGAGSRIKWDLGYYHWNYYDGTQLSNAAFLTPDDPAPTPQGNYSTATNAIFGEVTFPVTDRLRLIAGARESWDHRTFAFANNGGLTPTFAINFSHFDYHAGAEFDVAPRSMAYVSATSGYRPGGLSGINAATGQPSSFKSEVNRAVEIGLKNRFLDNHVQFNIDAFYYNQSGYQNLDKYNGFTPDDGLDTACGNGDTRAVCVTPTFGLKAHELGVEAQLLVAATRNDQFALSATFIDAKFNKNQATCATVGLPTELSGGCYDGYNGEASDAPGTPYFFNLAGAVQPHSPKFAGSFAYHHTIRFAGGARLSFGGDVFYTRGYWVNPVQDANFYGYQPAYFLENVDAQLVSADSKYSLSAYVRNIGNYAVKESVLPAQSIGDPLTFGFTAGVKF